MHGAIRTTSTTRQDQGVSGYSPMFRLYRGVPGLMGMLLIRVSCRLRPGRVCTGRRIWSFPLKSQCSRGMFVMLRWRCCVHVKQGGSCIDEA